MPTLSKTRIINLNYNDNKRTIYDEVFNYGEGEHTLFSMENGVGKTVLIQFFMQPFLKSKRTLAGRRFKDYFNHKSATYILHEIILDNLEKMLVGTIIKKEYRDDDTNDLKILAFTHKYTKPNQYDLVRIPLVKDKRILTFSEAEKIIKDYSRGKPSFNYYNFNDSNKKRDYFEYLASHKINHKEWESVIRKINDDESGLSNLYDKYRTDEALIRNEVIPLIEEKLSDQTKKINVIKENLASYVHSFIDNKEAAQQLKQYQKFSDDLEPTIDKLKMGTEKEKNKNQYKKKLIYIAHKTTEEENKQTVEIEKINDLNNQLVEEINHINYEKYSLEYYNIQAEEEALTKEINDLKSHISKIEDKLNELNVEKYILMASEVYQEIIEIKKRISTVQERLNNYERDDSEIAINIKNYKFNLKKQYQNKVNHWEVTVNEKEEKQKEISQAIINEKDKQRHIYQNIRDLDKLMERLKYKINNFHDLEEKFKTSYHDFQCAKNLYDEYDDEDLTGYQLNIKQTIDNNENDIRLQNEKKEKTLTKEDELRTFIQKMNEKINETSHLLKDKEHELKQFDEHTKPIINILLRKGLTEDVENNKDKALVIIETEIKKYQKKVNDLKKKYNETEDLLLKYETGLVRLPENVEKVFNEKGIVYQYGLRWLQKYQGPKEEIDELLSNYPFFPYSILLKDQSIEILKNESIETYTSIPIPIISESKLDTSIKYEKKEDFITIENQSFLVSFNTLLTDPVERDSIIKELKHHLNEYNDQMKHLQQQIRENQKYQDKLLDYKYYGYEGNQLEKDIKQLKDELKNHQESFEKTKDDLVLIKNKLEDITDHINQLKNLQFQLHEKEKRFNDFCDEHKIYQKNRQELELKGQELNELQDQYALSEEQINELQEHNQNLLIELNDDLRSLNNFEERLSKYNHVDSGKTLAFDINELESKLDACILELNEDKKRDEADLNQFNNDLRKKEDKLQRIIKEGQLQDKKYQTMEYSTIRYETINEQINISQNKIKEYNKQYNDLNNKVIRLNSDKDHKKNKIIEIGFNEILSKEKVKVQNFKERIKQNKEQIKDNNSRLKFLNQNLKKLQNVLYPLKEFQQYDNQEIDDFSFGFKNIDQSIDCINQVLNDYKNIVNEVNEIHREIKKEVDYLYQNYHSDRLINIRLIDYKHKDNLINNSFELISLKEIVDRNIKRLNIGLEKIKTEEETVIKDIIRYCRDVYREFKLIDKRSIIKHLGKRERLLEIRIPENTEEDSLSEYIRYKVQSYSKLDDYHKELDSDITTTALFSKYIGNLNRIKVYITKIEQNGLKRKSWQQTLSQNSGGEKFVSMFILLASFMSYMRRSELDFGNQEDKKIIIMDNPFAKTNAEHLLEPMFKIADKYRIQLICFSGIGGSSVFNRFNKIFVAKVISDKFLNKEIISFDKDKETLETSEFTIRQEQFTF